MAALKHDRVLNPDSAVLVSLVSKPPKKTRRVFSTEKERKEALVESRRQSQKTRITLGDHYEDWERQRQLCGFSSSTDFVAHLLAVHERYCPQFSHVKAALHAKSDDSDIQVECVPETPRKRKGPSIDDSFESPVIPIYKKGMSMYQTAFSRKWLETDAASMSKSQSGSGTTQNSLNTSTGQSASPSRHQSVWRSTGISMLGFSRNWFADTTSMSMSQSHSSTAQKSDNASMDQSASPSRCPSVHPSTSKGTPKQGTTRRKAVLCSTPLSMGEKTSSIIPEEEVAYLTPIKEQHGRRRRRLIMDQKVPHSPKIFADDSDSDDEAAEHIDPDVSEFAVSDDESDEEIMPIKETNWRDLRSTMGTDEAIAARKCIAFNGVLETLLIAAVGKHCRKKGCEKEMHFKQKKRGTCLLICWECPDKADGRGHTSGVWSSQPRVHGMDGGTLLTSTALMMSGNNYAKIALMAKFLKLNFMSQQEYDRIQSRYVTPAINTYWKTLQASLLRELKGPLVLAGDGRSDSPGHCAKYLSYSLMETTSKKIIALATVDCLDTDLNSVVMERLGFVKAMDQVIDKVEIAEVVTDAHPQIRKLMRTNLRYLHIIHQWDVWHVVKNMASKLLAAGKERGMGDIIPWIGAIKNHLWYAARTCGGNADKLRMIWQSVLYHVCGRHEWLDTTGHTSGHCEHPMPLPEEDREKAWIKPGSKAQQRLIDIVRKKPFVNNLSYLRNFRHTGSLETFHSHLLMYNPKRLTFKFPYYQARVELAVIDFDEHADRGFATDKDGNPVYRYYWSKGAKRWGATPRKVPKQYSYMSQLMAMALQIREKEARDKIRVSAPKWHDCQDPSKKRNIASVPMPPKDVLLAKLQSRFK